MKDLIKKYGSRKFILALLTNILCVATILSEFGGKIGLIASISAIIITTAIYIINETKIDVEAVNKIIQLSIDDYNQIKQLVDTYEKQNKQVNKDEIE